MQLRKVEFWGRLVETDVRLAGLCAFAFASRKLTCMHIRWKWHSGLLSLVIDDMVCYVGITMRDRLRALAPRMNIMYPCFWIA